MDGWKEQKESYNAPHEHYVMKNYTPFEQNRIKQIVFTPNGEEDHNVPPPQNIFLQYLDQTNAKLEDVVIIQFDVTTEDQNYPDQLKVLLPFSALIITSTVYNLKGSPKSTNFWVTAIAKEQAKTKNLASSSLVVILNNSFNFMANSMIRLKPKEANV